MLYSWLKVTHILSATLLLLSIAYSGHLWQKYMHNLETVPHAIQRIQTQTGLIIIPLAIVQLITGFSIISLQHYPMSELWISGSVIGFITMIASWLGFIYFLLQSQQVVCEESLVLATQKLKYLRRIQSLMLHICALGLLTMMFFMASRTATLHG
jgi:uncharacterized membrane protein